MVEFTPMPSLADVPRLSLRVLSAAGESLRWSWQSYHHHESGLILDTFNRSKYLKCNV